MRKDKRRRVKIEDEVDEKIIAKQKELQKIVPSTTYSNIVNSILKQVLEKDVTSK